MFLLDSLMISGISWTLETVAAAADAEMNDDTTLREQLLAAEMQRESGEISDKDYAKIERDLLVRIREIRERRSGGSGPLTLGGREPIEPTGEQRVKVEAVVSGDFHELAVLDVTPVRAETVERSALPVPARPVRPTRTKVARRTRKPGTSGTARMGRKTRTSSLRSKIRRP